MFTINIYNKMKNKNLYLFFLYNDSSKSSKSIQHFLNKQYLKPWADGSLGMDEPFVCKFERIDSGTFWYILANENGVNTIKEHPKTALPSDSKDWVGGFFEISCLENDTHASLDITNVDQVGLLCGIALTESGEKKTCGYGMSANDFIAGLEKACELKSNSPAKIEVMVKDETANLIKYTKLLGPTSESVASEYNQLYINYLADLIKNKTAVTIKTDDTSQNTDRCGINLKPIVFKGAFGEPDSIPGGSNLNKSDVVLWLVSDSWSPQDSPTYLFFTKDALNGNTVLSGNSAKGTYIHPAFEYSNPEKPVDILKNKAWAENVSLNWTAIGDNAVKNTTYFQVLISSVGRDIVTALNMGYIDPKGTYDNRETYKENDEYCNKWNKFITNNSDSYGMAYSDGTHAKVLYAPDLNSEINCYVFDQDDANTKSFWSKNA